MDFGASTQISRLTKAAAGPRNTGSQVKKGATIQSSKLASSKTSKTIHPGSSNGYNNSKSAYLSANMSGYDNPSNQKARYNRQKIETPIFKNAIQQPKFNRSKLFDMRMRPKGDSSMKRLSTIMNNRSI